MISDVYRAQQFGNSREDSIVPGGIGVQNRTSRTCTMQSPKYGKLSQAGQETGWQRMPHAEKDKIDKKEEKKQRRVDVEVATKSTSGGGEADVGNRNGALSVWRRGQGHRKAPEIRMANQKATKQTYGEAWAGGAVSGQITIENEYRQKVASGAGAGQERMGAGRRAE